LRPEADDGLAAATATALPAAWAEGGTAVAAGRARRRGATGAAGRDGRGRARVRPGGARKPAGCSDCRAGSPPGWPASWHPRPRGRLGLRGATALRRRRPDGSGGTGGGRHGGRGGTGTAARRDGRGRTRREGAGPYPSRRRAETHRLFRLLGSIP